MASEYERQAWANLGPGLANIFANWGQQKSRLAELKTNIAMAELDRRDRLDAAAKTDEYNREYLKMQQDAATLEVKRYDENKAIEDQMRELQDKAAATMSQLRGAKTGSWETLTSGMAPSDGKPTTFLNNLIKSIGNLKETVATAKPTYQTEEALMGTAIAKTPTYTGQAALASLPTGLPKQADVEKRLIDMITLAQNQGYTSRMSALQQGITDPAELSKISDQTWEGLKKKFPGMDKSVYDMGFVPGINSAKMAYNDYQLDRAKSEKSLSLMGRGSGSGGPGPGYRSPFSAVDDKILHGQTPTNEEFAALGVTDPQSYIQAVRTGGASLYGQGAGAGVEGDTTGGIAPPEYDWEAAKNAYYTAWQNGTLTYQDIGQGVLDAQNLGAPQEFIDYLNSFLSQIGQGTQTRKPSDLPTEPPPLQVG